MSSDSSDSKKDKAIEFFKESYTLISINLSKINDRVDGEHAQEHKFYVDPRSLWCVACSVIDDINRYKKYHLEGGTVARRADVVNRSAYMCKWLCKFKPIRQYLPTDTKRIDLKSVGVLSINERIAIVISQSYIAGQTGTAFSFAPDYLDRFIYDLVFRNLTDDALLHIFQIIFDTVKNRQKIHILKYKNK